MVKRSWVSLSATLGLILVGEGLMAHPIWGQAAPPPAVWGLPASCAVINRSGSPEAEPSRGATSHLIGDVVTQFSLAQQFSSLLAFIDSLPPDQRSFVLSFNLPFLLRQVEEFGTTTDKMMVQQRALQTFQNLQGQDLLALMLFLQSVVDTGLLTQQLDQAVMFSAQAVQGVGKLELGEQERRDAIRKFVEPFLGLESNQAALTVGDASNDPLIQAFLRSNLAKQAVERGQPARAEALLREALPLVRSLPQPEAKVDIILDLARLSTVPLDQVNPLVAEAEPLVRTIKSNEYKATLLVKLAQVQQRLGQAQAAEQSLRQVVTIAQTITRNPSFLSELARVALASQQPDLANQLLELDLKTNSSPDYTRSNFARIYAEAGLIDQALSISAPLSNSFGKNQVQVTIALGAIKSGRTEQGLALINRLPADSMDRQRLIREAIIHFLKTGQEPVALQLAQQPANYSLLLTLIGFSPRDGQMPYTDWVIQQATRLATQFPEPEQQKALQELSEKLVGIGRFDRALPLQARLKNPALKDAVNRRILNTLKQGIQPYQEAQIIQLLTTLPDSPLKRDIWLEVMNQYANRGRSLAVLPTTGQAVQWVKMDRAVLEPLVRAYQNLRAFKPGLEVLDALQSTTPDPLGLGVVQLDFLIETSDLAAARLKLTQLRQAAEQAVQAANPKTPVLNQILLRTFLAPYYAEVGDRTEAMTLLSQAGTLMQQPAFRQEAGKTGNRYIAEAVIVYARVAHLAAGAGEREVAQQAIAQGQKLLQQVQPYRPDITAAQTLTCVQSIYQLK